MRSIRCEMRFLGRPFVHFGRLGESVRQGQHCALWQRGSFLPRNTKLEPGQASETTSAGAQK